MNKKKEIKASLSLIVIIIASLIATYFGSSHLKTILIFSLSLIFLFVFFNLISSKTSNKFIKAIDFVISSLAAIFYIILKFYLPFSIILFATLLYIFIVTIIPGIFIDCNNSFKLIQLSEENYIFLTLIFSSISSIIFYKPIIKLINKILAVFITYSKKTKNLFDAVEYTITLQNIIFAIYTLYFIYLLMFSFYFFEHKSIFKTELVDYAVLQSFLAFLAFDSLRRNSREIKFLSTTLLKKIFDSFKEEEKRNN